jgi:RNA polymerase sigma-70 factor (ECF subfamily)
MDSETSSSDLATLTHLSDGEILAALRDGRLNAIDVLYDRYAKQVYSLAYKILANSEEAEDITQDVFLTLWQRDAYQSTRGSLKAFLTTLTRSRSIDKLRSQGSRSRFLQRWQRLSASEPEILPPLDHLAGHEQAHLLRQALECLSSNEREILEIAYYEGVSQTEISKRLNLPLGTVKSRSRQGLSKLRQHLKNSQ